MAKRKSKPSQEVAQKPRTKPAMTFTPRDIKCQGYLHNVASNLGLDRRPTDSLEAVAKARTLKSHWGNGGLQRLPNVLARVDDNVNCLRNLKGSPFEHTARALVLELRRDVPREVLEHPGWSSFIDKMSSAIGA